MKIQYPLSIDLNIIISKT